MLAFLLDTVLDYGQGVAEKKGNKYLRKQD